MQTFKVKEPIQAFHKEKPVESVLEANIAFTSKSRFLCLPIMRSGKNMHCAMKSI